MIILITYDLNKPGKDYSDLYAAIDGLRGSKHHPLESIWLLDTDSTPKQVANILKDVIDTNDSLLVIRLQKDYGGWLTQDSWDWLNGRTYY
jgi:hypothetical protein